MSFDDQIILLVYCMLLEIGGIMGYMKGGSKASIIASTIFGGILLLFIFNVLPFAYYWTVLVFLILFFGMRFAKGRKFVPNGLMLILTIAALVLTRLF